MYLETYFEVEGLTCILFIYTGANFICYACRGDVTDFGRLGNDANCSKEQELLGNNAQAVNNCTAHGGIVGCYALATYKFGNLTSFKRDCAAPIICNTTKGLKYNTTSGNTTTVTSCCKSDHCNSASIPLLISGSTSGSGTNGSGTMRPNGGGGGSVEPPLSLLHTAVSALLFLALYLTV